MQKSHTKVSEFIWDKIYNKELEIGDKIPSERDLAKILGISRNSVREGLRVLDNVGIISSQHGSGNYVSAKFEDTITEIMSFMYIMRGMNDKQITEFRYALEWQAVNIVSGKLPEEIKEGLLYHLEALEDCTDEDEGALHDKAIHYLLIEATGNDYMICNYSALTKIISMYIPKLRGRIIVGMKSEKHLQNVHRQIIEGLIEGDTEKSLKGLHLHFNYIIKYQDS